mgnify:CR=1 FL=1
MKIAIAITSILCLLILVCMVPPVLGWVEYHNFTGWHPQVRQTPITLSNTGPASTLYGLEATSGPHTNVQTRLMDQTGNGIFLTVGAFEPPRCVRGYLTPGPGTFETIFGVVWPGNPAQAKAWSGEDARAGIHCAMMTPSKAP